MEKAEATATRGAREAGDRENEYPWLDRRTAVYAGVGAVVLALGVAALIGEAADYGEIVDAVKRADKRWLPLCVAGQAAAYAGYVVAYRDFARVDRGPELPLATAAKVVGIGFGAFVVGSTPGGLAFDFWALRRAGAETHEAVRRVLALNTFEWGVLGSFATLSAAAVLLGRGKGAPLAMTLAWLVAVPVSVVLAAWVSSRRQAPRFVDFTRDEAGSKGVSRRGRAAAALRGALADAIGGLLVARALLSRPKRYLGGVLGYPLFWIGQLVTLYAAIQAFAGGPILPTPLVLAFASGYAATALPLPVGGAGGIEAALTFSLHAVGVGLAPALLAVLVYRLFTFWLPIVPALALLPLARRLSDELAAAPLATI